MDLVGIAEIVSAAAVLVGFGFAVSEVKRHRGRTARESALALVSAYQTPEFANAIVRLIDLPGGLTKEGLHKCCESDVKLVGLLMTTWESLGILTYRREVSLELLDDFFSGPIVLSWEKFETLVREMREESGRETYFEWFQWLAERMAERESDGNPVPAHIEHKGWRDR
jgi:hypothetical protein